MKKILMILGAIFICLILAGVIVFSALYYFASGSDKEAEAYIDEVVPIIVASWNSKELINRTSPEFLHVVPAEKIELLFNALSKQMGPLEDYKGATGKVKIKISPRGKPIIIADYMADPVFEKAPAKIQIRMILQNDKWQIIGFRVIIEGFTLYK